MYFSLSLKSQWNLFLPKFAKDNTVFLLIIFLLKSIEFFWVNTTQNLPEDSYEFLLRAYAFDFGYVSVFMAITLIPFFILYLLKPIFYKISYFISIAFIIIIYFLLIIFFKESLIPLDASIFIYSFKEIQETINASGNNSMGIFFILFLLLLFAAVLYLLFRRIKYSKIFSYTLLIISIVFLLLISESLPRRNRYSLDISYFITNNKLVYFIHKTYLYLSQKDITDNFNIVSISKNIQDYQSSHPSFNYQSKTYPFLHQSFDYKDKIGGFFNFKKEKPNIVIIITESLSRAFSGEEAYLTSFTPFLDSLAEHSLYWKNTVATAERTFGAPPSILASVPYGKEGFSYYQNKMPYHISLLEYLHQVSYHTNFYYGGWNYFQSMGYLFDFSHVDTMLSGDWGKPYHKLEKNKQGFSWGYPDEDLFRKAMELEQVNQKKPLLDIFLTLNMHSPFIPPKGNYYFNLFEKILTQKDISEEEKQNLERNKKELTTVLSTDDAMRYYINLFKKRKDFENTIFIITGDHRMGSIYHRSKVDKYHVPLIIYSPLLKEGKRFSSVVSHLDITPTIAALMRDNFKIPIPENIHWLGQVLDTTCTFKCNQEMAFMRNSREIIDYLSDDYFLSEDVLYQVQDDMKLTVLKNDSILKALQKKLNTFKILSLYSCEKNKVYPVKDYLNFMSTIPKRK